MSRSLTEIRADRREAERELLEAAGAYRRTYREYDPSLSLAHWSWLRARDRLLYAAVRYGDLATEELNWRGRRRKLAEGAREGAK